VRSYKPGFGVGSIGDVAYFGLRTALGGFREHRCDTKILGATLTRRLSAKQRRELYSHLPAAPGAYFRHAIGSLQN